MEINDIVEKKDYDEDHKLNFINSISIDTFNNIEKNIKKSTSSPIKIMRNKQHLFLGINVMNKDFLNDIESTGNYSEKNTNKGFDISVTDNNLNNKKNNKENEIYINKEETNNNLNSQNFHVRKDIYGTEIKKGGKQRISFADNVQLLRAKIKLDYNPEDYNNDENSLKITKFNSEKRIKQINGLKRSILQLRKFKDLKQTNKEASHIKVTKLVEVIEIEKFKEENKNEYINSSGNDEGDKIDKETVCCSASCNLF